MTRFLLEHGLRTYERLGTIQGEGAAPRLRRSCPTAPSSRSPTGPSAPRPSCLGKDEWSSA
jgi:hypothetical protein